MKKVFLDTRLVILSLVVVLVCQMLVLDKDMAFASVSNTVTLEDFTYSYYDNGERAEYNKHGYFVGTLGAPVFCGNHCYPSPTGDELGDCKTLEMYTCSDKQIRKILYYGYKGPKEWSGFSDEEYNGVYNCATAKERTKWCGNGVTAMALTMTQQEVYVYDISGLKPFLEYIDKQPEPPKGFEAYYMGGQGDQQKLFTWIYNPMGSLKVEKNVANPDNKHNVSLANGCYEVYSNSSLQSKYKVSTLWTKEDGKTNAISLKPGKYYVKEVTPPKGYTLDETVHQVEVKEDEVAVVKSYDYLQTAKILLYKIDYSLKDQRPRSLGDLDKAIYGVYLDKNLTNKVGEIETNRYGIGTIENLLPNKYYIKELKAPAGFTKNDEIIEVNACAYNNVDVVFECYVECYDHPIITSFAKYYEDSFGVKRGLKGAKLQLIDSKGEVVEEWVSEEEPHNIKYLPVGKYTLREVEAPRGYIKSEDVTIQVLETNEIQYFHLDNKKQNAEISFIKELEKDSYGVLKGVFNNTLFGLYDEADNLLTEIKVDENGTGKYLGQLDEGKYYLKELQTEEGYILSELKYDFEVRYDNSGRENIEIVVNDGDAIVNEFVKGKIIINKRDKATGTLLEGVGFKLYNSEKVELAEAITDSNGQITFENLPIGVYYIKETKPAEGYIGCEQLYCVNITADKANVTVDYLNAKPPVEEEKHEEIVIEPEIPDIEPLEPEIPEDIPEKEEQKIEEKPAPITPEVEVPQTGDNSFATINIHIIVLCILGAICAILFEKYAKK